MSRQRRAATTVDLVIVGAGLAGLAAGVAASNAGLRTVVLEASAGPGGLARSLRVGGHTFDCSGHLLHLAREETRDLVHGVTRPDGWAMLDRRSAVVVRDQLVPYPFQLHLAHAPSDVRDDCVAALPVAELELPEDPGALTLDGWIEATLGAGIGRHFMVPYNEKLTGVPVTELTCRCLGRFVPRPAISEIREGAASRRVLSSGYNARFLYPLAGGIDLLWRGLAERVEELRTGARVVAVDSDRRSVRLATGEQIRYREAVVSSAPLPAAAAAVQPRGAISPLWDGLRSSEVMCVNVGLRRLQPRFDGVHWLYLPERRFAAYRIGFYNAFSEAMSPTGRAGAYVEIAHSGREPIRTLVRRGIDDLVALGAVRSERDVHLVVPVPLRQAYVIHDGPYERIRPLLLAQLERHSVFMVGRYGRWEYASMEDALWQGIDTVGRICSGRVVPESEAA